MVVVVVVIVICGGGGVLRGGVPGVKGVGGMAAGWSSLANQNGHVCARTGDNQLEGVASRVAELREVSPTALRSVGCTPMSGTSFRSAKDIRLRSSCRSQDGSEPAVTGIEL